MIDYLLGLQVHQGFSMPAGQLLSLDDPPRAECQYSNLVLEGQSYFPGHSILPFPVGLPMVHPPSPQQHMDPQVIVTAGVQAYKLAGVLLMSACQLYADFVCTMQPVLMLSTVFSWTCMHLWHCMNSQCLYACSRSFPSHHSMLQLNIHT